MKKVTTLLVASAMALATHAQSWSLTGNAATNPSTNFLGTTDNQPLKLRVNNTVAGEINSNGKTAFGSGAGMGGNGTYVTAIGYRALSAASAYENTAVGAWALQNSSGNYNTGIGYGSLQLNTSGAANAALGYGTIGHCTTGTYNVGVGPWALSSLSYGSYNTAVGTQALYFTTGAQYNTAIGYNAGELYDLGYNNTILGANCQGSFAGQYNMVAIGQGVVCPDNSTARIGNSATWSIGGWAGWSNFSDGRYKKDIQENVKGLGFIMKLRPVTYRLNVTALSQKMHENGGQEWNKDMKQAISDKEKMVFTGFVAQEVEKAAQDAGFAFSGVDKPRSDTGLYALRYADFVVPLVKAMQEQQQMIQTLQSQVETLQQQADVAIVLQSGSGGGLEKISTYPDPVSSAMTVSVNTQTAGPGKLAIFDGAGRLVREMNINIQQGMNTFNLSLPSVASGYYTLTLDWGGATDGAGRNGAGDAVTAGAGTRMHKSIAFVKAN